MPLIDSNVVLLLNQLSGRITNTDTLAKETDALAHKNENSINSTELEISRVESRFNNQLDLKANLASLQLTQEQVATVVDRVSGLETDEVVINTNISELQATATSVTTQFTIISNGLNATDGKVEQVKTMIQESADGILIGKSNSPVKLRITNSGIEIIANGDVITYWNDQSQLSPKMLKVPEGGNFSMGSFRWIPRSSGNLSLVKVGN